jgi:HAD superfamily hydrolase (TIGR01509 family)
MIDTILFDAEGVVLDTEDLWDRGQEEFLRRRGFIYDREHIKPLLTGRTMAEGVETMQEIYGFKGDIQKQAYERVEIVKDLFRNKAKFMDGFLEFFSQVRGKFKVALATAMDELILAEIEKNLHLGELFSGHVYTLSQVNFQSKPNPDLFLLAASRLNSDPKDCIVIEDAPHGIEAARRAAMHNIGLATTYRPEQLKEADVVFKAFNEINLAQLLSDWEQQP